MVESHKVVLGYWKIRGLAQSLRMQLAHSGADWEDKMYVVHAKEDGSWDRSEWTDTKDSLNMDFPNLPYLQYGDYKVSETVALHRYIAAKFAPDTCGSTAHMQANIDMMWNILHPLRFSQVTVACYTHGDKQKIKNEAAPKLKQISNWLKGKQYFAGDELTWIDFYAFESAELFNFIWDGKFFEEYPEWKQFHGKVASLP